MSDPLGLSGAAVGLTFLLGLRHGLDPDHIAVIDNFTFRTAEARPRVAPWVGTLFATGHSLSIAAIVMASAAFAAQFAWPSWMAEATDWAVIGLLILVGAMNLRALRRVGDYRPVAWRGRLLPVRLRESSQPLAIVAVGVIFGLVFETATQAAAWGAAATGASGLVGALAIAVSFATGMILTDTADSQVVASLLGSVGGGDRIQRYRRALGGLIVALSLGMAAYALAAKVLNLAQPPAVVFTAMGLLMALGVAGGLATARMAPATERQVQ